MASTEISKSMALSLITFLLLFLLTLVDPLYFEMVLSLNLQWSCKIKKVNSRIALPFLAYDSKLIIPAMITLPICYRFIGWGVGGRWWDSKAWLYIFFWIFNYHPRITKFHSLKIERQQYTFSLPASWHRSYYFNTGKLAI